MTDQDPTPDEEIGDMDPDDSHDDDDGNVDWSNIDEVSAQVDGINAIENEDEKTEAAKEWAAKLGGE